ncbi:17569_t:CDS:2, partial [Racocetra fulgida]
MTVVQLEKGAELEMVYLETGRPNSSQDKRQRDHKKLIRFSKDSIDTTRKISKLKRLDGKGFLKSLDTEILAQEDGVLNTHSKRTGDLQKL